MNDIGDTLKKLRKKYGFTQNELAEKSNVSRTYLSDVENRRYNPSIPFIKNVADGLANGNELLAKDIYFKLMEAMGYIDEQRLVEKQFSEFLDLSEFIRITCTSIESSELYLNSSHELNSGNIKFHQEKIKESKILLEKLIKRNNELINEVEKRIEFEKNNTISKLNSINFE